MAAGDRPYSRVYHEILTDPKFETIFHIDTFLAAWLRLLLAADVAWPQPVALPRWIEDAAINQLVGAGLIQLLPGAHYKVKGLDRERAGRSAHGKAAATARWSAPGNAPSIAPGNAQPMLDREREQEREVPVVDGERRATPAKGWEDFDRPEWDPFRLAWTARGFRLPPTGRRDSTSPSQRKILWEIAQDRPLSLGKWVADAPKGSVASMVVGYVIERWKEVKRG